MSLSTAQRTEKNEGICSKQKRSVKVTTLSIEEHDHNEDEEGVMIRWHLKNPGCFLLLIIYALLERAELSCVIYIHYGFIKNCTYHSFQVSKSILFLTLNTTFAFQPLWTVTGLYSLYFVLLTRFFISDFINKLCFLYF